MLSFWDGFSTLQREEFCKNFLIEQGYVVWGPLCHKSQIKTIPQLVRFFYDTMARHRDDVKIMHAAPSKADKRIMLNLVNSRIKMGMSKKRAIVECCLFIEKLFEYESKLLKWPITSVRVLGQDEFAWITERVWRICEQLDADINKDLEDRWFEDLYRRQAETVDEEETIKALENLERILKSDAKEKETG